MNRKKTMHRKHVMMTALSGLVVMGLLASQPAAAIDGKTYPETMCQPSGGDVAKFFVGTLNLDPNAGHQVNCPIVRDTIAGKTPGINSAFIAVYDLSSVEDVQCILYSLFFDGSISRSSSRKSSGAGFQVLQFGSLDSGNVGNYKIVCRIPKAAPNGSGGYNYSSIASYRVDENE